MRAIEFMTVLDGTDNLRLPREVVSQLPDEGTAKVIVLLEDDVDEAEWRAAGYEQFLRDDAADDTLYEHLA